MYLLPSPILRNLLSLYPVLVSTVRFVFIDYEAEVFFWGDIWRVFTPIAVTLAHVVRKRSVVTIPSMTVVSSRAILNLSERTTEVYFLGEDSIPVIVDAATGQRTIAVRSAAGRAPDKFQIVRVPRGEDGGSRATRSDWFGLDRVWDELDGVVVKKGVDAWIALAGGWSGDDAA